MPENSYAAPRNSANYNELISIVREHPDGGTELARSLSEILWGMNVPGHLRFFGWVTEKLGRLLKHRGILQDALFNQPETISRLNFSFLDQIDLWVEWYKAHQEQISSQMGQDFEFGPSDVTGGNPSKKNPNPFQQKGLARYGLYAALVCIQEVNAPEIRALWELLALRFILTHEVCYRAWSLEGYESFEGKVECPDILDKTYIPAKNLRILSNEECAPFLGKLALEDIFKDEFQGGERTDTEDEVAAGGYFNVLLGYMGRTEKGTRKHFSKESFTRSDPAGRENFFGQGYVEIDERRSALHSEFVDIDDPWSSEPPLDLVEVIPNVDGLEPEELALIELYPPEFADGDQLTLVGQDCGEIEKNTGTAALAARARNKHLATQAQMFRWRYGMLTFEQFKFLNLTLRSELPGLESPGFYLLDGSSEQDDRQEAALILLSMLWTSSDLDRVLSLSAYNDSAKSTVAQLSFHDLDGGVSGGRSEWIFQSLRPKYFSAPQFNESYTRPRVASFWLPDLSGLVPFLNLYRNSIQDDKTTSPIFMREQKKYECLIKSYLKELNKTACGEGITLNKISDFLFHQITGETGDVTVAACITAKPHYLVNTSIFYTTPKLDYLRTVYEGACEPLLQLCGYEQSTEIPKTKNAETSVGARLCVTVAAYKQAIESIQADLKEAADYSDWQEFVSFHNLFTFYSILMFGFASAARAIKSPLLKGSEIDVNGFSTITDKDTTRPYHSRLIWLQEMVQLQLVEYERHKEITTNWLKLKSTAKEYAEQVLPCYFIVGQKLNHMQVVKPKELRGFYNKYIQVPVNAHRRLLRTELLEEGMPVEALDALMGHWFLGQEPWGPYSTFSIPEYVSILQDYLVPLMDELGFKLIKSPLVLQ